MNQTDGAPTLPLVSPEIARLHAETLTLDSHIDIPWPHGPDPFQDGPRRVDLPKMRRGGISAGCFVAYLPQDRRSDETHQAAFARATAMLQAIRGLAQNQPGIAARITETADAVEQAHKDGKLAIIPVVENGFAIGTDIARLRPLRALGARYLTLTHNGHNALADSANPRADLGDAAEEHGGLSALGRAAVAELNRLGMLVDVSHTSVATMRQAVARSRSPVVASHSCIRALCDHPRNLDNDQLDLLRDSGGLVQITAVSVFLRAHARPDAVAVGDFVDHIDYAVQRIGIEHVGISSDFDGGGGFSGWHDAGDSLNLTVELARRGYGPTEIAALWGGNFLRLMRQAEALAD